MVRVAAIDCGTNSIRLLVTDIVGAAKTDLDRRMQIVRLGQDVDRTGALAPEAIDRTVAATREYVAAARALGVDQIRFCATSAARDASNAADFAAAIAAEVGSPPEILTGQAEARASFLGATRELGSGPTALTDIGGGSTEVITGAGERVTSAVSLDIGSVRLTERFLASDPPTPDEVVALTAHLDAVIDPVADSLEPIGRFVGVAGTVTTVAAHALVLPTYDSSRIHGAVVPIETIRAACADLLGRSVDERRALGFMHPGRADVIGAGAVILDRLLVRLPLQTPDLVISERDILDGIAWGAAGQ